MGLAASQSRLLSLTSRMHDLEYKSQKLEAQKLQMANKSQEIYSEYSEALNKTKMQLKTVGTDGSNSYVNVTSKNLGDAGYAFEVVAGANSGKVYKSAETAFTAINGGTLSATNLTDTDAITNLVNSGQVVLVKVPSTVTVTEGTTTINDITTAGGAESSIGTDTNLQEVSDETDLKKAEAKYEADLAKINSKDKKFDTDIASVENERNAIKTEIDTLKTVAKDNVERTFKLFG